MRYFKHLHQATLRLTILVLVVLVAQPAISTFALSEEQKRIEESGIQYFDHKAWEPPAEGTVPAAGPSGPLTGCDNAQKIYNFLTDSTRGLSPVQAAGLMGNLQQESGFNPDAREPNGIGYGIAQWSFGRRTSLEAAANQQGVAVSDLQFQLEFLYQESVSRQSVTTSAPNEWEGMKLQTSVEAAVLYWEKNFERAGIPNNTRRIQFGNDVLARFGSGGGC